MNRKVLIKLAAAIARIENTDERGRTAQAIGEVCIEVNGRFDWSIWREACNV